MRTPAGAVALSAPLASPAAGPWPRRAPNLSGARSDRALIRSWLALKPSPHTLRAYAHAVQAFLAWSGPTPLAAVTVTLLQAWRAQEAEIIGYAERADLLSNGAEDYGKGLAYAADLRDLRSIEELIAMVPLDTA